jgi:hypothetical protein
MAQATTFNDLLNLVLPEVPGCPTALAVQHLQMAARQFCADSEAWQEKLEAIDLVADDVTYTLTPAYDAEIRRVTDVWIRTAADVTAGDDGTLLVFDKYEYAPAGSVLTLDDTVEPQEAVTDGLVVKVVLVPYLVTNVDSIAVQGGISATFLNYWAEPIMARTKHTLMRMVRTAWANPQMAGVYQSEYLDGVSRAKTETDGLQYRNEQNGFGA